MKRINLIPFIVFIACFSLKARSQEFSYKHYEIKDGLVGNNVYQVVEDKEGFLWFATETGVSRFDGTKFKNFTTSEGLPDNEILKMFVDSRGRVWMMPFKNYVCYYYKGKIYNEKNDSTLKRLRLEGELLQIFEDGAHNMFFVENRGVIVLQNDNKILRKNVDITEPFFCYGGGVDNRFKPYLFLQLTGKEFFKNIYETSLYEVKLLPDTLQFQKKTDSISFFGNKQTHAYVTDQLYIYLDNMNDIRRVNSLIFNNYMLHRLDTVHIAADYNLLSFLNDSTIIFNTNNGALQYNLKKKTYTYNYLTNEQVSYTIRDHEGNLWFTTLGNGVYRLYSEENNNISFIENNKRNSIESILVTDSNIIAGSGNSIVYKINKSAIDKTEAYPLSTTNTIRKVIRILKYRDDFYVANENKLYKAEKGFTQFSEIPIQYEEDKTTTWAFKDVDIDTSGYFYVGTHLNTIRYSLDQQHSYLERMGRVTAVCVVDSGLYLGTLNGLLFINHQDKIVNLAEQFSMMDNRVTKLLSFKNKLWIGTNDEGLICYDGKKIEKVINSKSGLTGNLVRALYGEGDFLWIGTDRGLNKILVTDPSFPVQQNYTTSDGLSSNMINAVYARGDTVYVGTPKGLSFFNHRSINSRSVCNLRVLGITVSGQDIPFTSKPLFLKKDDNNIRFDFVAISYRAEGNIVYYYKLSGIDSNWKTTRDNFLQYPTLPSGSYSLELYAVNKFGVKSETITINFNIEKHFFEQAWFTILIVLMIVLVAWLLAAWRIRKIRSVQAEKTANAEKIAQLEQQALKAQMNPHFIFNCLNSIQQYVIDKDILGANRFISGFSKLIRETLDNSGKQVITVAEEESFLRSYLELEKSRFENKFDYNITIDTSINKSMDSLPPMLLQPYIENCIRHGIMHKSNGKGIININFNLVSGNLLCSVTDNGVGREAANAYKSAQHINYQSKGTELTRQRIMMINKSNDANIILKTEDLFDEHKQPCGTKVTLVIPLEENQ